MAGVILATATLAEPVIRPLSRDDAIAQKVDAAAAALAAFRVMPRPAHMIRYPVAVNQTEPTLRPVARAAFLPNTRWDHKRGSDVWTRAAMSAIAGHADALDSVVPRDIDRWCPAYAQNSPALRRAFWVGMMSALAKYESTYNPTAVGGGNRWFGLLQIYPDTARRYGCRARTGEALKNPTENLSCAARIMAVTVARDRAVALHDGRWRGVAADWGPMTSRNKIAAMSDWTRAQSYCEVRTVVRPQARPVLRATVSTMDAASPGSG
ncbi:transglycosylase SLT domain-containing protein [Yoonia sp. R2331]|uniref:transglycosylase SLT domain-containing protein n=1 Tax=Yoonia sp. R2331 TaxID=3237238 RepID=UPI0034E43921